MRRLLLLSCFLPLLAGCAAAVVGGAAAAGGAAHDRRSVGTVIDDQGIELAGYDALNRDKELALENNVELVAYNGVLLVIGEVRSEALRQRALSKVQGIQGVRRVVDELAVREKPGLVTATRDKWLTARTKTALFGIKDVPGFDPSRVNVTTQTGVVYLMGLLSRAEAERVVDVTRNIGGVERVVKVFEYTD